MNLFVSLKKDEGMAATRPFTMRASGLFLAKIDEWRRAQPDIPNRGEAIRRLVDAGLEAEGPQPTLTPVAPPVAPTPSKLKR